jgi:hypothetical protein
MSTDNTQPMRPRPPAPGQPYPPAAAQRPAPGQGGWPRQPPPYGSEPGHGGPPGYGGPPGQQPREFSAPRRRGRRRAIMSLFTLIVVVILLVIGDRVAKAIAENQIASQVRQGDPAINPSVSIAGFPFLNQVAARDIHEIDISASNVQAGPVAITTVHAVAKGVHVNGSFSGGTVDTITATAFIGFAALSTALSSQASGIANLTLAAAGNDEVTASFSVLGEKVATETGKVSLQGNHVSVAFTGGANGDGGGLGGLVGGLAGGGPPIPDLSFTIPKLPADVQVKSFSVAPQGITFTGGALHAALSQ